MRVLVVEDDIHLTRQLASALERAGYSVDVSGDGEDGQLLGDLEPYDAVILDLSLPRIDGLNVLRHWRQAGKSTPVLILTARDTWKEKVLGFDAGADDYVAKPFYMEELLARLAALIRRSAGHADPVLSCGPVRLDTRTWQVAVSGSPVKLTAQELKVLSYLMHHKGRIVSRDRLAQHIYDLDYDGASNTIEVFITRLRKKLGASVIQTHRGQGYRLAEPADVA